MDITVDMCREAFPKIMEYCGEPVRVAEVKYDGYLVFVIRDAQGRGLIVGKKQDYTPYLEAMFYDLLERMPVNTCIAGELYLLDQPATAVVSAIKGDTSALRFCVLMWMAVAGETLIKHDDQFPESPAGLYVAAHTRMRFPEVRYYDGLIQPNRDDLARDARLMNVEGFVLKNSTAW